MKKTFQAKIVREGSMCLIPVTFDPKPVFGSVRAKVKVTLNGYTYRSTIASMGDGPCIPLRKSNREAAGLEGGETLRVTLELDTDKRVVTPPADLVKALKAKAGAWQRWGELSYTHQREYVEALEGAKKPETRARRLDASVRAVAARPAKRSAWYDNKTREPNRKRFGSLAQHCQAHEFGAIGCADAPAGIRE